MKSEGDDSNRRLRGRHKIRILEGETKEAGSMVVYYYRMLLKVNHGYCS